MSIIIQEVEDTAREQFLPMNEHWTASVHQTFSQIEGRLNSALLASSAVRQGLANHRELGVS